MSFPAPLLLVGALAPAAWAAPPPPPPPLLLLWDNGPVLDASGLSVLQDISLGMATYGFLHSTADGSRVADDFELACRCGARLSSIAVYAYQTGSSTLSAFNDVRVQIWAGRPGEPGSSVVAGNLAVNRLMGTAFINGYRVSESVPGSSQRPIMVIQAGLDAVLGPGVYWLDWQTGGLLASGPWAMPITLTGQAATGNARQFVAGTGQWRDALDVGTLTQQGFPFRIYGSCDPCVPTP